MRHLKSLLSISMCFLFLARSSAAAQIGQDRLKRGSEQQQHDLQDAAKKIVPPAYETDSYTRFAGTVKRVELKGEFAYLQVAEDREVKTWVVQFVLPKNRMEKQNILASAGQPVRLEVYPSRDGLCDPACRGFARAWTFGPPRLPFRTTGPAPDSRAGSK
jgi:hypothetical protein